MRDPDGMVSLFDPSSLVHNPNFQRPKTGNDFTTDRPPQFLGLPRTVAHELLQSLGIHSQPRRHWLDRLALPRHQQPLHVPGRSDSPFFTPECTDHRLKEARQPFGLFRPLTFVPWHDRQHRASFTNVS